MNPVRQSVQSILERFSIASAECQITDLGNHGGFSGAQLWRVRTFDGTEFCLRCWPPQNDAQQQSKHLAWIHSVLASVVNAGFPGDLLPLPFPTKRGQSILELENRQYELTKWLPGKADFVENPSGDRINSAAKCLAEFHSKSALLGQEKCTGRQLRGIQQRLQLIDDLNHGLLPQIAAQIGNFPMPELGNSIIQCFRALEPRFSKRLAQLAREKLYRQVCIRDIWHDHVFFDHAEVSGIVDFGAMGWDHPATDISRLFGSLFLNSREMWGTGLEYYHSICELSDLELELIEVYDRTTTMLAGMNWLKWILVENRNFESFVPIKKRMDLLVNRMQEWL